MNKFLSLVAVTALVWVSVWPVGQLACADSKYKFNVAFDNPTYHVAAAQAKAQACKTVASMPL